MPINVDNDCFHCPVCTHYHKLALSDILPGLKRRCNREGAVIVEIRTMNSNRPIIFGSYSPSQNGIIVHPKGIALCLTGGGKGHDVDKPKILLEYE